MNREKFEALPEIKAHLHNVVFDIGSKEYLPKKMGHLPFEFSAYFLNGAYYAFCEQEKRIEKALGFTEDVHSECWQDSINCIREVLK